jgi:hypothetical protein
MSLDIATQLFVYRCARSERRCVRLMSPVSLLMVDCFTKEDHDNMHL